jgi:hypothetical protein
MTSATHTRRPTPAGTPDEQLLFPMSFRDEGELRAYEVHEVRALAERRMDPAPG